MPEHVDDVAEGDAAVVDGVEGLEGGYFSGFIEGREEVSGPRGGEDREGGVGGVGGGEGPKAGVEEVEDVGEGGAAGFQDEVGDTAFAGGGVVGEGGEVLGEEGGAEGGGVGGGGGGGGAGTEGVEEGVVAVEGSGGSRLVPVAVGAAQAVVAEREAAVVERFGDSSGVGSSGAGHKHRGVGGDG